MSRKAQINEPGSLEALAEVIAARVSRGQPTRPLLRVVPKPKPTLFDSITRESIFRRVRFLRDRYQLQFLIDQATFNLPNMDCLEDAQLSQLLKDMEAARECIADGIPFEDRGLILRSEIPEIC